MLARAPFQFDGGRSFPNLGEWARNSPVVFADGFAAIHVSVAVDSVQSKSRREAATQLVVAERYLHDAVNHREALKASTEAVRVCNETGDKEMMANALRLVVKSYLLKASIARFEKGSAHIDVTSSLKKAAQIAEAELKLFRATGLKNGEAAMMLSIAEIQYAKGGNLWKPDSIRDAAQDAHRIFQQLRDTSMQAAALLLLAHIHHLRKDRPSAQRSAEEAVSLFRTLGDKVGLASALHAAALSHALIDTVCAHTEALQLEQEALVLFRGLGLKRFIASTLVNVAILSLECGRPDQAIPPAKEAIDIVKLIGCGHGGDEALALSVLVHAYIHKDEFGQALQAAKDGVSSVQASGDHRQEVIALDILTLVQLKSDLSDDALRTAGENVALCKSLDDKDWEANALLTICQVQMKLGKHADALESARRSAELLVKLGQRHEQLAIAHYAVADVHFQLQSHSHGLLQAEEALDVFSDTGNAFGEALTLILMAGAQALQDLSKALASATRAKRIFHDANETRCEAFASYALVQLFISSEDFDSALQEATSARGLLHDAGFRRNEATALLTIACVHYAKGDATQASKVAREGVGMTRSDGDRVNQVHFLLQAVQANVLHLSQQNEQKNAKSARDEAAKFAREALVLAKKVGQSSILAPALFWNAQTLSISHSPDAMSAATEALGVFRRNKDKIGEAHTLVLQAQLQLSAGSQQAAEQAHAALAIYQQFGDAEGIELATKIINFRRPAEQDQLAELMALPPKPVQRIIQPVPDVPQRAQQRRVLEPPAIQGKLRHLVADAVDTDEIPAMDTPLMDSGLDSLASVSFRNEVAKEFDMTLPASLMFDYPTLGELTSYLVERSSEE